MSRHRVLTDEQRKEHKQAYDRAHAEQRREYHKKYRQTDQYKEYRTNYYTNNKKRIQDKMRKYYKDHTNENKANKFKHSYNITIEEYNKMYKQQQGKCAICYNHLNVLCVDHDHNTNRVRGLLCGPCNTALGMLKDNSQLCLNMIKYLEDNKVN